MKTRTNLAVDLEARGCPACNNIVKIARDFFARWQFALTCDKESQSSFAAELGFCPQHFWQLHSMSSPWGESAGLLRLAEHVSRLLAKMEPASSNVQNLVRTSANCRVCRMLDQTDTAYIRRLGSFVEDEKGRQIYEQSQGTCLHHLAQLLAVTSDATREFLLATASRRLEKITEEMQNYAAKREAVRRDLINRDEEDASLRAVIHLAGAKDYSAP